MEIKINRLKTSKFKGYRNRLSDGESIVNSTWFFGGSTIWGFANPKSGTIPSIFHKKTNQPVFNLVN